MPSHTDKLDLIFFGLKLLYRNAAGELFTKPSNVRNKIPFYEEGKSLGKESDRRF